MSAPYVTFSPESATTLECITWATKSIIAGDLVTEAKADMPATARACYRVCDDLLTRLSGPQVFGGLPYDEELVTLCAQNGIMLADEGTMNGLGPIALKILIEVILAAIQKALS